LIEDVPKSVVEAEKKRVFIESKAEEFLKSHKNGAKTYLELL